MEYLERLAKRKRALERAVFAFCAVPYKPNLSFLKILDSCICDRKALRDSRELTAIDIYDN